MSSSYCSDLLSKTEALKVNSRRDSKLALLVASVHADPRALLLYATSMKVGVVPPSPLTRPPHAPRARCYWSKILQPAAPCQHPTYIQCKWSIFGEAGNIGYSFPTTLTRAKETTKAQNAHSSSSVKVYEVFSKDECTTDRLMSISVQILICNRHRKSVVL